MGHNKTQDRPAITASEANAVLQQFRISKIDSVRSYFGGSSNAPKARVYTAQGDYLLKRIAPKRASQDMLRHQHRLQLHLRRNGFSVPQLVTTLKDEETLLECDGHLYELMSWVEGMRFSWCADEARSIGTALASMHDLLEDLALQGPQRPGFHDRRDVARAAMELAGRLPHEAQVHCETVAAWLGEARRATRSCWSSLPMTVNHGDWHPGNLLMRDGRVVAVIDWESARAEPRVSDLANALLQFSLHRASGTTPAEWPVKPETELLRAIADGYNLLARTPMTNQEIEVVPDLTIEAMSAEAIVPLYRKGRLRDHAATLVLPWVVARLHWIRTNRDLIRDILSSARVD